MQQAHGLMRDYLTNKFCIMRRIYSFALFILLSVLLVPSGFACMPFLPFGGALYHAVGAGIRLNVVCRRWVGSGWCGSVAIALVTAITHLLRFYHHSGKVAPLCPPNEARGAEGEHRHGCRASRCLMGRKGGFYKYEGGECSRYCTFAKRPLRGNILKSIWWNGEFVLPLSIVYASKWLRGEVLAYA